MKCRKCRLPDGVVIKPDGIHALGACLYRLVETHKNVTVNVYQCSVCGDIDFAWHRQDDTESVIHGYFIDTDSYDYDDELPWTKENPNF